MSLSKYLLISIIPIYSLQIFKICFWSATVLAVDQCNRYCIVLYCIAYHHTLIAIRIVSASVWKYTALLSILSETNFWYTMYKYGHTKPCVIHQTNPYLTVVAERFCSTCSMACSIAVVSSTSFFFCSTICCCSSAILQIINKSQLLIS